MAPYMDGGGECKGGCAARSRRARAFVVKALILLVIGRSINLEEIIVNARRGGGGRARIGLSPARRRR
jgi:hypothetical protein